MQELINFNLANYDFTLFILNDRIFLDPPRKPTSPRRRTKLEKYRQERAAAQTGSLQGLDVTQDDFFILIEVDELKYQLEVIKYRFFFFDLLHS